MNRIQDITVTRLLLRQGIVKGYWTLEDLDTPSQGWEENAKRFRIHYPNYQQPVYRNPLREPEPGETVQVSNPRDFEPASGPTPAEQPPLPVTLEIDHTPTPSPDAYLEDLNF